MNEIQVYALLNKKIKSAASGISNITKKDGYIIFVMSDGTEFKIEDSEGKQITSIDLDDDNYIVISYDDKTETKSENPIPTYEEFDGATKSKAGTMGLVPRPSKGDTRYLNSKGEWDGTVISRLDALENTVPVEDIPENSTLTSDGWVSATEDEVNKEFAKWED